jgi:hypothetical protein
MPDEKVPLTIEQEMKADGYVPVAEAVTMAGVSTATMYRWIRSGKIEATECLGRFFVKQAAIARLKERRPATSARPLRYLARRTIAARRAAQ